MKTKAIFFALFVLNFLYSQKIKFTSIEKQNTIEGILIINKSGEYITKTDINGEVDKNLIEDKFYILSHPTLNTDTLFVDKISNNEYKVHQIKEMKIPEIVINNSTKDYIISRGFFNSYVTNNGEFNIYIDGIIEYVFDRKTNNLKDSNVIEYRSFYVEDAKEKTNRKEASTFVFDNLVKLPNLSFFEEIKNNNEKITKKYNETSDESIFQFSASKLTDKELKFLGYTFTDVQRLEIVNCKGENAKINNILNFSDTNSIKIKHKSEQDFSKIITISNYYPKEIIYKNKDELSKGVKFKRDISNFKTNYWQNEAISSVFEFLSSKFKENFKQSKNVN